MLDKNNYTYGWLGTISPYSQRDGFFIDENNEILYWPTKNAPGHKIDYETAIKICLLKGGADFVRSSYLGIILGLFVGILALFIVFPLAGVIAVFLQPFCEFILGGLSLVIISFILANMLILSTLFLTGIAFQWYRSKFHKLPLILQLVESAPKLQTQRPNEEYVNPAMALMPKKRSWISYLALLLSAIGLWSTFFFDSLLIGDQILIFGISIGIPCGVLYYRYRSSVHAEMLGNIRFYDPPDLVPKQENKTDRKSGLFNSVLSKIFSIFIWLISGWRLFVFGLPLFFLAWGGSVDFMERQITAEILSSYYERSVFGEDSRDNQVNDVFKWRDTLSIYIEPSEPAHFGEDLRQGLLKLGQFANLDVEFTNGDGKQIQLNVNFTNEFQYDTKGEHIHWKKKVSSDHNNNQHMNLTVSLNSLRKQLKFPQLLDSGNLGAEQDRIVEDLSLIGLGFLPQNSEISAPKYVDNSDDYIPFRQALVAMHYHTRVQHGDTKSSAMKVINKIAAEIEYATSFKDWLWVEFGDNR